MYKVEINLTESQYERLMRLKIDAKHSSLEESFDEMLSLLDNVYAARSDKYDEVVFRDSKRRLPDGRRRERIYMRKF